VNTQIAHTFTIDTEIRERLSEIEKDLFFITKSDKNLHKYGLALNPQQKKLLDKYHSSVALKSSNSGKLAINL